MSTNGDAASIAKAPAVPEPPAELEGEQSGTQGGAQPSFQAEGLLPIGDTTTPIQDSEPTADGDEVSSWESEINPNFHASATRIDEDERGQSDVGSERMGQEDRRKSTPGLIFTNEYGEEIEDSTEDRADKRSRSLDGSGSEYETAEEWGDTGQGGGWMSADDDITYEDRPQVDTSEALGGGAESVAAHYPQTVEPVSSNSDAAVSNYSGQTELTSPHSDESAPEGQVDKRGLSAKTDGLAPIKEGGEFYSDPFAETKEGGVFDSDPFAETKDGGVFDSDPFAETKDGGVFDSDPFAETTEGGAFVSELFSETKEGGAFDSDLFAKTKEGGAFYSNLFAELKDGGAFDSDPFAERQQGGAFDSDPFAETKEGGAFDSDPFAETKDGGAFDSDPFAETQFGDKGGSFEFDPFPETSREEGVVVIGDGRSGWHADPFANSYPAASPGTEGPVSITSSLQAVNESSDLYSTVTQQNSICGRAEGNKEVNMRRIPKEPENSDMSEDEAANRRFGKLYQELDKEKEKVPTVLLSPV